MIDIHSHILPGIDDGCPDLEESLAFARAAVADGVTGIVATPHSAEVLEQKLTTPVLVQRVAGLNDVLRNEGIPLTVYPGSEVFAEPDSLAKLRSGQLTSINLGRYVLLEPPLHALPLYFESLIFELQTAGYIPILAHPERNAEVLAHPDKLFTWVNRGALAQVTSASLLGSFGRQVQQLARKAVQDRWVQILASDAHGSTNRVPEMTAARADIAALIGEQEAESMAVTVPAAIVANELARFPFPIEHEREHRGFFDRVFRRESKD